jgi:hypothetical protein
MPNSLNFSNLDFFSVAIRADSTDIPGNPSQAAIKAPSIANSAASYANSAFASANSAGSYANSAFTKANTDFTNITAAAATYGNAISIPSITLTANGRVSAISNTAIVIDPIPNILMLSGM